jgi:hypothetical protein
LFTITNLHWIYEGFYLKNKGITVKKVAIWIEQYITPLGLAHWIKQDGSYQQGQGINLQVIAIENKTVFY